jgi:hypothetical protein
LQGYLRFKQATSPAGIKYKFGIQVPKGIKNAIDLHKKNGNQLWEEAIKAEMNVFTDYQAFILLDSGGILQQLIRKFLTIWFMISNIT